MSDKVTVTQRSILGITRWLGGAFYTAHQPGMEYWDGLIWLWYVGRYVAADFATFHY